MKCFYCKNEIDESKPNVVTEDGDVFHSECLEHYKIDRDHFFNEIINDDKKYFNWFNE